MSDSVNVKRFHRGGMTARLRRPAALPVGAEFADARVAAPAPVERPASSPCAAVRAVPVPNKGPVTGKERKEGRKKAK